MKILIIEDQPDLLATLRDILEVNGHEVLAAGDGVEGVRLASESPEFIFCDVQMPNLDGYGVLAAIKGLPEICDIPFVFLTARAERSQLREGMSLGADDYITKPFSERDIRDAIAARTKRHLNVRERVRELAERHRREINARWSHELLTPLNAVIGSLDLLELDGDEMGRGELKEMLALIREGAERQEKLARKLICYFGLEQRRLVPSAVRNNCHADKAIAAALALVEKAIDTGGRLAVSVEPGEVPIDEESLAFAIGEIAINACNFSAPNCKVRIAGTNSGGRYRIEITDQGKGMTAEQRTSFGAFIQFDRNLHEQQGLGLGLAIARSTATLANGQLALEDAPSGRGLSVIFDLPLAGRGE
jgi:two-component system sensor histidine kinase/response regulator